MHCMNRSCLADFLNLNIIFLKKRSSPNTISSGIIPLEEKASRFHNDGSYNSIALFRS